MTFVAAAFVALMAALAAVPPSPEVTPESLIHAAAAATQAEVRARYGPAFREIDTEHFRVISDTSPRAHRVYAAQLEGFYRAVHPRFFTREMPPLKVILIHGGADFENFMNSHHLEEDADSYGMYEPTTHTVYARRCFPDGQSSGLGTVFHETGHAMLQVEYGRRPIPSWFNEGFAALFERGRVMRGIWVYGNPNPRRESILRRAYDADKLPSLEKYLNLSDESFRRNGGLSYAVGRSFFLYLLRRHGEDALRRFVAAMRAGRSPVLALGPEWTIPKLEKAWRQSMVEINFGGVYLYRAEGPKALEILQEGAARHPGYGNLEAELARQLAEVKKFDEAIAHARAALRDPRCTSASIAWSTLGYALWTKDVWATRLAFRTAIRYQPWDEEVMEYEYTEFARLTENCGDRVTAARLRRELAAMKAESVPEGCGK